MRCGLQTCRHAPEAWNPLVGHMNCTPALAHSLFLAVRKLGLELRLVSRQLMEVCHGVSLVGARPRRWNACVYWESETCVGCQRPAGHREKFGRIGTVRRHFSAEPKSVSGQLVALPRAVRAVPSCCCSKAG
jgi:hypothetical protein